MSGPGPLPIFLAVKGDADMDLRMTQCSLPPSQAVLRVLFSPVLSAVLPIRLLPKVKPYCHKILPNKSALIKSACNLVVETILSPRSYCGFPQVCKLGILTKDGVCATVAGSVSRPRKTHKSRSMY